MKIYYLALVLSIYYQEPSEQIKKIVVLMMENRSFDHYLGFMKRGGPFGNVNIDGLTGNECNLKDLDDPSKGKICVNDKAVEVCEYDPNHSFHPTTERLYTCGTKSKPCPVNTNAKADMGGFSASAIREGKDGVNEMTMWPPEKVPILTTLANEFAVFDRFFASHPGPTWPNRCFLHSGTTKGIVETGEYPPSNGKFDQLTIFELLDKHNKSWSIYNEDSMNMFAMYLDYLTSKESMSKMYDMKKFYKDVESGNLPEYTFIEPRMATNKDKKDEPSFGLSNWQHPVASILEGERLIKNVYESLRNGPNWNETLLIVTFDEHGGFYDHVSPPSNNIPSPDEYYSKDGFKFNRLGIRVPTIAISPWIKKQIVNKPTENQKQNEYSEFETASIPATILKLFGIEETMTKRTSFAALFDDLITDEYRTDCPKKLADLPDPDVNEIDRINEIVMDDTTYHALKVLCRLNKYEDDNECGIDENMKYGQFLPKYKELWDRYEVLINMQDAASS